MLLLVGQQELLVQAFLGFLVVVGQHVQVQLRDGYFRSGRGFALLEGLLAAFLVEASIGGLGCFSGAHFGGVCMSETGRSVVVVEFLLQDLCKTMEYLVLVQD